MIFFFSCWRFWFRGGVDWRETGIIIARCGRERGAD